MTNGKPPYYFGNMKCWFGWLRRTSHESGRGKSLSALLGVFLPLPGLRNRQPVFRSSVSLTSSICEFTIGPRTPYFTFSTAPGRGIRVIFILGNEQGPKRLSYLPTSSGEMTEDRHGFEHVHLLYGFLSHTVLHCRVTKDSHLHGPQV